MTKSLNQTEAEAHLLDVFWRLSEMGQKDQETNSKILALGLLVVEEQKRTSGMNYLSSPG